MNDFFEVIERLNLRHRNELKKLHAFILGSDIDKIKFTIEEYAGQALMSGYVVELTERILGREDWDSAKLEKSDLIDELIVATIEPCAGNSFQLFKREKYREAIATILREVGSRE